MVARGRTLTLVFVIVILVLGLFANGILYLRYRELAARYNGLFSQNQDLTQKYNSLSSEYDRLKQTTLVPPYASISNGTIHWVFYDLSRRPVLWEMPLETYKYYVSMEKPVEMVNLKAGKGSVLAFDVRPYIQPSFFRNIIGTLSQGRSDKDFVKEVDNIKDQIVIYGREISVAPYQFPCETLTEGRGVCSDTTILMASMLAEASHLKRYDFKVYVCYVQMTANGSLVSDDKLITEVNHALVEVKFSDGTFWGMETTTDYFHLHTDQYFGWRSEVTTVYR
jgi:hypothetical protein